MLNGRVKGKNDLTHVSHRGRYVVDYVFVPHEQYYGITFMNIFLMTEITEKFDLDRCDKIPDHSLLFWESEVCIYDIENIDCREQISSTERKTTMFLIYLNDRVARMLIEQTIEPIEMCIYKQHGANDAYSAFTDLIHS